MCVRTSVWRLSVLVVITDRLTIVAQSWGEMSTGPENPAPPPLTRSQSSGQAASGLSVLQQPHKYLFFPGGAVIRAPSTPLKHTVFNI